jgi:hypothetical protein
MAPEPMFKGVARAMNPRNEKSESVSVTTCPAEKSPSHAGSTSCVNSRLSVWSMASVIRWRMTRDATRLMTTPPMVSTLANGYWPLISPPECMRFMPAMNSR